MAQDNTLGDARSAGRVQQAGRGRRRERRHPLRRRRLHLVQAQHGVLFCGQGRGRFPLRGARQHELRTCVGQDGLQPARRQIRIQRDIEPPRAHDAQDQRQQLEPVATKHGDRPRRVEPSSEQFPGNLSGALMKLSVGELHAPLDRCGMLGMSERDLTEPTIDRSAQVRRSEQRTGANRQCGR